MFFDKVSFILRVILLSSFTFTCLSSLVAQDDKPIDGSKMPYARMEKLLRKGGIENSSDIDRLRSTCIDKSELSNYSYHSKTYFIDAPIEEVWEAYKTVSPAEAWQGNIGSFAFMYSRYTGELKYIKDDFPGIEEGQVIFLNLRFLRGIVNLAVGQEVIEINDEEKLLKFCYLENGASDGSQSVQLHPTPDGRTRVIHQTYYRSNSEFRDQHLYPLLHSLIIKEYHSSIASMVER